MTLLPLIRRGAARLPALRLAVVCALAAPSLALAQAPSVPGAPSVPPSTSATPAPSAVPRASAGAPAMDMTGRVVKGGQGVPGLAVQLHRVTRSQRGVLAESRTGADGAFRFRLPAVDSADGFSVFFATAEADGVRYFGRVLHAGEAADGYEVEVFDTTTSKAAADSVRISRRDVFLLPSDRGGWEVAELVTVTNDARRTLLPAADRPLLGLAVPEKATDFEAGSPESTDSAGASGEVVRMRDRAWLTVPLNPGTRDFFFRYRVPEDVRSLPLPLGRATDTLNVYVRQPAEDVEVSGLGTGVPWMGEGEQFMRYSRTALQPGAAVSLAWEGPSVPPVDPRILAVVLAALVLAAGAFFAVRRNRGPGGPSAPPTTPA